MQVRGEDYERVYTSKGQESPYFKKNYGELWQHVNIHQLHDLVAGDWQNIIARLTDLHARAYNWKPPVEEIGGRMAELLQETVEQEARLKIKGLVEYLDLVQQKVVEGYNQG